MTQATTPLPLPEATNANDERAARANLGSPGPGTTPVITAPGVGATAAAPDLPQPPSPPDPDLAKRQRSILDPERRRFLRNEILPQMAAELDPQEREHRIESIFTDLRDRQKRNAPGFLDFLLDTPAARKPHFTDDQLRGQAVETVTTGAGGIGQEAMSLLVQEAVILEDLLKQKGEAGIAEVMERRSRNVRGGVRTGRIAGIDVPFAKVGEDIGTRIQLSLALKEMEKGTATSEQAFFVREFLIQTTLESAEKGKLGGAVDILSAMPAFASEILSTSGLAAFGRTGTRAAIGGAAAAAKRLIGPAVKTKGRKTAAGLVAKNLAEKAAVNVGGEAVRLVAGGPHVGRVAAGSIERQLPSEIGDVKTGFKGQTFLAATVAAATNEGIELVSERLGAGLTKQTFRLLGGNKMVQALRKSINTDSKAFNIFARLPGRHQVEVLRAGAARLKLIASPKELTKARKAFEAAGLQGPLAELVEERFGDVMRAATRIEDLPYDDLGEFIDQVITEGIAFSLIPGGRGATALAFGETGITDAAEDRADAKKANKIIRANFNRRERERRELHKQGIPVENANRIVLRKTFDEIEASRQGKKAIKGETDVTSVEDLPNISLATAARQAPRVGGAQERAGKHVAAAQGRADEARAKARDRFEAGDTAAQAREEVAKRKPAAIIAQEEARQRAIDRRVGDSRADQAAARRQRAGGRPDVRPVRPVKRGKLAKGPGGKLEVRFDNEDDANAFTQIVTSERVREATQPGGRGVARTLAPFLSRKQLQRLPDDFDVEVVEVEARQDQVLGESGTAPVRPSKFAVVLTQGRATRREQAQRDATKAGGEEIARKAQVAARSKAPKPVLGPEVAPIGVIPEGVTIEKGQVLRDEKGKTVVLHNSREQADLFAANVTPTLVRGAKKPGGKNLAIRLDRFIARNLQRDLPDHFTIAVEEVGQTGAFRTVLKPTKGPTDGQEATFNVGQEGQITQTSRAPVVKQAQPTQRAPEEQAQEGAAQRPGPSQNIVDERAGQLKIKGFTVRDGGRYLGDIGGETLTIAREKGQWFLKSAGGPGFLLEDQVDNATGIGKTKKEALEHLRRLIAIRRFNRTPVKPTATKEPTSGKPTTPTAAQEDLVSGPDQGETSRAPLTREQDQTARDAFVKQAPALKGMNKKAVMQRVLDAELPDALDKVDGAIAQEDEGTNAFAVDQLSFPIGVTPTLAQTIKESLPEVEPQRLGKFIRVGKDNGAGDEVIAGLEERFPGQGHDMFIEAVRSATLSKENRAVRKAEAMIESPDDAIRFDAFLVLSEKVDAKPDRLFYDPTKLPVGWTFEINEELMEIAVDENGEMFVQSVDDARLKFHVDALEAGIPVDRDTIRPGEPTEPGGGNVLFAKEKDLSEGEEEETEEKEPAEGAGLFGQPSDPLTGKQGNLFDPVANEDIIGREPESEQDRRIREKFDEDATGDLFEKFPTAELNEPPLASPDGKGGGRGSANPGAMPVVDELPVQRGDQVPPAPELVNEMGRLLGTQIRVAPQPGGSDVAGTYHPSTGGITIRWDGDLWTAAHELGHALDDRYGLIKNWYRTTVKNVGGKPARVAVPSVLDKELQKFWWSGTVDKTTPLLKRRTEGVAVWLHTWMVNPDLAIEMAPKMNGIFESLVPDRVRAGLRQIGDQVRQRAFANVNDPLNAGRSHIEEGGFTEGSTMAEELRQQIKDSKELDFNITVWDGLKTTMIDELAVPMKAWNYAMQVRGIEDLLPKGNFEMQARLIAGHETKIQKWLERGPMNANDGNFRQGWDHGIFDVINLLDKDNVREELRDLEVMMTFQRTRGEADLLTSKIASIHEMMTERFDLGQQLEELRKKAFTRGQSASRKENEREQKGVTAEINGLTKEIKKIQRNLTIRDAVLKADITFDIRFPAANMPPAEQIKPFRKFLRRKKPRLLGVGAGLTSDMVVVDAGINELRTSDPARFARLNTAANKFRDYANAVLEYMVDKGRLDPKEAQQIIESKAGPDGASWYVPFQRVFEKHEQDGVFWRLSTNLLQVVRPLTRFAGSTRRVKNPMHTLAAAMSRQVLESDRNEAVRSFVDMITATRGMHSGDVLNLDVIGSKILTKSEEEAAQESKSSVVVPVWRNGKLEKWRLNKKVGNAMKKMGQPDFNPIFKFFAAWPQLARRMITLSPDFLVRNVMRDSVHRYVVSEVGSMPFDAFRGYSHDELVEFYAAGGGQFGHYMTSRKQWNRQMEHRIRKMQGQRETIIGTTLWLGDKWADLAASSETVNRIAEYRVAKAIALKSKADGGLGYDEYNARMYAAFKARDLLDFAVAGSWMKPLNQMLIFTNAQIQGIRRVVRAARTQPRSFAIRVAQLSIPMTLAEAGMAALGGDEEELWQRPAWRRDLFWGFKIPFTETWLEIPKPHEIGLFSSAMSRVIAATRGDRDAFTTSGGNAAVPDFVESAWRMLVPFDEQDVLGPYGNLIEAMMNQDWFRNRPLIPPHEAELEIDRREGTKNASRFSRLLSQIMRPLPGDRPDPRVLDFLIRSQFGGLGKIGLAISDLGRDDRDNLEFAKRATGLLRRGPAFGARSVQVVMQEARKKGKTSSKRYATMLWMLRTSAEAETNTDRADWALAAREFAGVVRTEIEMGLWDQPGPDDAPGATLKSILGKRAGEIRTQLPEKDVDKQLTAIQFYQRVIAPMQRRVAAAKNQPELREQLRTALVERSEVYWEARPGGRP